MKKLSILLMITLGITSCKHQAKKEVSEITPKLLRARTSPARLNTGLRQSARQSMWKVLVKPPSLMTETAAATCGYTRRHEHSTLRDR